MQSSENQYGIDSIDDMEEQMKLYAVGQWRLLGFCSNLASRAKKYINLSYSSS